ncbi:heme-binding protein 2 [Patella vulgata]|uniref:heme-binding protein 2 n=1 Tax=Patella vulgata TaxID=6465 RepID=UPI00217FBAB7|nr:heme-binding protein 2 [Patella vulgata]
MMFKAISWVFLLQLVHGNIVPGLDLKSSYQSLRRMVDVKPIQKLVENFKIKPIQKLVENFEQTDGIQQQASSVLKNFEQTDGSQQATTVPKFCHKLDCPAFTVVKNVKGKYEKRSYPTTHWVSTQLTGIDFTMAQRTMFMKLFHYISGNNSKGEKIAMTVPVIMRLIPGAGPACESNFTMSFYISNKVTDPPAPNDPMVTVTKSKPFDAYVKSFSGYMLTAAQWVKQARQLATDLNGAGESYIDDYFYTAGYDNPLTVLFRHNEVWYMAE